MEVVVAVVAVVIQSDMGCVVVVVAVMAVRGINISLSVRIFVIAIIDGKA